MKQVTKVYDVYDFDELGEKVKEKVINNCIQFFVECYDYDSLSPAMQKAVDKAERMQTPWFIGSYIWDYAESEILEECKSFEYFEDGLIFTE